MRSSIDDIIDLYIRDLDVTLIDECLKMTPEERIRTCEDFNELCEELEAGVERFRDSIR